MLACPFENSLKDMSGKRITSNNSTTLSTASKKFGTASASFNGTDQYLSLADASDLDLASLDFTIEFWAKTSSSNSAGANCVITQSAGGASSDSSFYLGVGTAFGIWLSDGSGWDYSATTTGVTTNDGLWHHFAAVRNGTAVRLFVDGTQYGLATLPADWTVGNSSRPITVGVQDAASPGAWFNGALDSLRITNGYARYTSNFSIPSAAFPVGKDETVDPFWSYTVLAMHMEDYTDSTGRHSISNSSSTINTSTYKFGTGSAYFSGSTYFTISAGGDFNFGTDSFTIEYWIYSTESDSGFHRHIDQQSGGGWFLRTNQGGWNSAVAGSLYVGDKGNSYATVTMPKNTWVHVAFSKCGTNYQMFMNGTQVFSGSDSTSWGSSTTVVYVGGSTERMVGYIDDLRITKGVARYAQNFTPPTRAFATTSSSSYSDYDPFFSQVALLLGMNGTNASTTFSDASTTPKTVTALGNAKISTSVVKFGSGSASFDGTSSTCLSVADHSDFSLGSADFTIELFLYANSTSGGNCIVGKRPSSGGVGTFLIWLSSGSAYFYLSSNGSSWDLVDALGFGALSTGTWTHLAAVRSGTSILLFKDGAQVNSATTSGTLITNTDPVRIGAESNTAYFNGYVDDLRITKGVARYTTAFAPPRNSLPTSAGIVTSGLVACLDAGDCLSTNARLTTNLLSASEQFDNASWSKLNSVSISANTVIAPDGTLTAEKFVENSDSSHKAIAQLCTIPQGATFTVSIFVKSAERTQIMLHGRDSGYTNRFGAFFELSTGAITSDVGGSGTLVNSGITAIANGWYRIWVTGTTGAANTQGLFTIYLSSGGNIGYSGNGSSGLYVWGAQLEVSPSAGPYIRTGQNLISYSETLTNGVWSPSNLTVTDNSSNSSAPNGSATATELIENTASSAVHFIGQIVSIASNQNLVLSVYVKAKGRTKIVLYLYDNSAVSNYVTLGWDLSNATTFNGAGIGNATIDLTNSTVASVGNGWYRVSLAGKPNTASNTGVLARIVLYSTSDTYTGDGSSGVYVWGAQLEAASSAGPYIKTPITDYIPGSRRVGSLTTNLLTYSEQFDNAAWTKTRASVSANSGTITAPDGSYTADKFIEDTTTTNSHQITSSTVTVSTSQYYTASCFLKAAERSSATIYIRNSDGSANYATARFDLSAGTASAPGNGGSYYSNLSASIAPIGNGWYRCSLTAWVSSSASSVKLWLRLYNGTEDYTGDGASGLYLWGAQLEVGNQPGPYVPTTSASASGGGTWCNLVQSPADGSSPAAYDFKYGDGSTTSTFPKFNGYAGGRSANDAFSFDGNYRYWTVVNAPAPFISSLHKAGAKFTIAVWVYRANDTSGDWLALFATKLSGSQSRGMEFTLRDNNSTAHFYVDNGSGASLSVTTTTTIPKGRWSFLALSQDESVSGFFYLNGQYASTASGNTFTGAYSSPSSLDIFSCRIASHLSVPNSGYYFRNGDRLSQLLLYNTNLSKSQLDTIFNATRSRFNV